MMSLIMNNQPRWSEAHAVIDIADLVRREGTRVYSTSAVAEGFYQSALCGLNVVFLSGGAVCAINAPDIDLEIDMREAAIEQDDGIERKSPVKKLVCIRYVRGTAATLAAWHQHLCAYRQSMRLAPSRDTQVA